jgi:hypothetical protein
MFLDGVKCLEGELLPRGDKVGREFWYKVGRINFTR